MRDQHPIKLFCSNVRGLVSNWHNICSFDWNQYDILAFNEVWNIREFENVVMEGYEVKATKLRQLARGGGTIIFGRKELSVIKIDSPFVEGCLETTCIKVGKVVFINVYRPPSGNKDMFVEVLSEFLNSLRACNVIIGGDFNLNTMVYNYWLNTICNMYDLEIRITGVTRVESGTCIDNFLSNTDGIYKIEDICIADHQAITASFNCGEVVKSHREKFTYRETKESNWLMFNHYVHNLEIRGTGVENKWENLLDDIKKIVDVSFPLKESKKKYFFTMSTGLLKSRDKKNRLLRQYKRGLIAKEIYINYNRIYRKLIKTEQCSVFKEKLIKAGNNGKLKWKAIKSELMLQSEKSKIANVINNGENVTEDIAIARTFKTHFETCATKLTLGLPTGHDTSTVMPLGQEWSFQHTTEVEVVKIIKSLKNKNSSGYDSLTNRMLKKEQYAIAKLVKPLINESIDEGIFPTCLKTANVIPIFKKGDLTNLNNYRPISLLPVLSKVFEKVLNAQITKVIECGYIDENQFGFRRSHNTEDAVLKFVDKIQKELSVGKHVVTVYIDVSKAFDSCDHKIIINKLGRTGLNDHGKNLMSSYLKDRKQLVMVNGVNGGYFLINIGVGQGTVLGPTLFKIYIMDLHLYTDLFCVKFADDSSFECSEVSRDAVEMKVNNELQKISEWFKNNRLTLHPDKSRFMVHSRDKLVNLRLDGKTIMRCGFGLQEESVKLLGVYIDEDLSWKIHVNNVVKKIGKGNYLLWRHGKKLNISTKKVLYESFIRSHLLYCLTVWGSAKNSVLKPLQTILRKTWKKIGPYKQHTLNRLQQHNILKLEHELEIQEAKLVWKWSKGKIPSSLKDIIKEKPNTLRSRRFESLRNVKLDSINYRLSKRASKSINKIDKFTSIKSLSNNLSKEIFSTKYSFTCENRNCFICQ